jgi:hypothetical protein
LAKTIEIKSRTKVAIKDIAYIECNTFRHVIVTSAVPERTRRTLARAKVLRAPFRVEAFTANIAQQKTPEKIASLNMVDK